MEWLFDGLGTMLIGLVLGGAAGTAGGWNLAKSRLQQQSQKSGNEANQVQVGRDYNQG